MASKRFNRFMNLVVYGALGQVGTLGDLFVAKAVVEAKL